MINPEDYLDKLTSFGVEFFTGVPDSLLKEFCACISNKVPAENHIIAANEGGAIGLGIGHYLGSGKVPLFIFKIQDLEILSILFYLFPAIRFTVYQC